MPNNQPPEVPLHEGTEYRGGVEHGELPKSPPPPPPPANPKK